MRFEQSFTIGYILVLAFWLAAIAGWVMNVIWIARSMTDPMTGLFILRCIGVIFLPLGAVLGWIW